MFLQNPFAPSERKFYRFALLAPLLFPVLYIFGLLSSPQYWPGFWFLVFFGMAFTPAYIPLLITGFKLSKTSSRRGAFWFMILSPFLFSALSIIQLGLISLFHSYHVDIEDIFPAVDLGAKMDWSFLLLLPGFFVTMAMDVIKVHEVDPYLLMSGSCFIYSAIYVVFIPLIFILYYGISSLIKERKAINAVNNGN